MTFYLHRGCTHSAVRTAVSQSLAAILFINACMCYGGIDDGPAAAAHALSVTVVEGDGAVNNIRSPRALDAAVRVTDAVDRPVRGAIVTFTLPSTGAGASFADGARTVTVRTDEDGRAAASGLKPNRAAGPFEIRVLASADGEVGRAVVHMTNVDPNGSSGSKRKLIVLTAVAGAAAAGVLAATSRGSSSAPATQPSVVVPGTPTVGAPR